MPPTKQADPKSRAEAYRSRVFVGGSYQGVDRSRLDVIRAAVTGAGFNPVIADLVSLENQEDIHHETMVQLHSCRLAIFELSQLSGALMEIERVPDYGIQALVLFAAPSGQEHLPSRMLSTFVNQHQASISLKSYLSTTKLEQFVTSWLETMRKAGFG